MKVFVVGNNTEYANWISNVEFVDEPKDADLVFFTGGEDVSPQMYGKTDPHKLCYTSPQRDEYEKRIFDSLRPNQHCIGVCRGSQFLCSMNGGNLVQDCTNHAIYKTHPITDGRLVLNITSTHHQMQDPYSINKNYYKVLFWSLNARSAHYYGQDLNIHELETKEPEIVIYNVPNKPKCIAIQGHPEMMVGTQTAKYLDTLIQKFIKE